VILNCHIDEAEAMPLDDLLMQTRRYFLREKREAEKWAMLLGGKPAKEKPSDDRIREELAKLAGK